MKTAQFPAVKQARKVVEKQAMFYMAMMRDEHESQVVVHSGRRITAAKPAPKRKKSTQATFACTA